MPRSYPEGPYFDDYDRNKGYVQILAVPGKAEQAREFTQLGTMTMDFIGRLGDAVFNNGAIIDGCTLIINDKKVTITSGRIYLDGLVRLTTEQTLDIDAVGTEIIGAKIVSSLITENEDQSLRDPAQGYENYGQEGAHRRKEVVQFTVNDEESTVLFKLDNGSLVKEVTTNSGDNITDTLARRTYDESGNYKVKGLELRDRGESTDEVIKVSLTEGKAYIKGYEVEKLASTTINLEKSLTTRQVTAEPKIFSSGRADYRLNNQPACEFTSVIAVIQITDNITRGNIRGGIDYLTKSPVVNVISVSQGSTEYKMGTDYQLTNDGIDWSLLGEEPNTGTTYQVTWTYNKKLVVGTDIELYNDGTYDYIRFLVDNEGAVVPVDGSTVNISYSFYLARKDLICLNKDGEVVVIKGKPDLANLTESEINQKSDQISIGTVLILPNSDDVVIANTRSSRLSQDDLYKILKRVESIEYNMAMDDLDKEAEEGEDATTLKGIFTDGFYGLTKADIGHPEFNCTIDLDNNELTLPTITSIDRLSVNSNTYETEISKVGEFLTAPYVESVAINQPYATSVLLVNPYAVYDPLSLVKLSPAVDNWIDTEHITINQEKTSAVTLRRWWYHRSASWAEAERQKYIELGFADGGESLKWDKGTSTSTSTTSEVVLDEAITYMRQTEVNVSASNFTPGVDNIKCYFDDTLVPLTPTGDTLEGTEAGTVKAKVDGTFTAKFTVPPNVPCGSVDVVLKSSLSQGSAVYQAKGRQQVIQDTVLTVKTTVNPTDPLAQSFMFDEDTVISSIGLYFATKDDNKSVIIQIRNMINGYPGTTCYSEETVSSSDINVSSNGTVETKVKLSQPVYCNAKEQYCVCIISDSNLYSMFTAELGGKELSTGAYITSNPYMEGVLFSSSNALTWTAHQSSDLKFNIYKCQYTGKGSLVFNDISDLHINRLLVAAQAIDYQNAGIEWNYRINDGAWLPIETYVDRELSVVADKVSLKAVLNTANSTSPIISGDCINLIGFIENTEGTYVSRTITMSEKFSSFKVVMDVALPSGTGIAVFYMLDDGEWHLIDSEPTVTQLDEEFNTYQYDVSEISSYSYKVKIEMVTSNPLVRPRIKKLRNIMNI